MKRILFYCLTMILPLSCQKVDECYSCDTSIDSFVKSNLSLLKEGGVTALLNYDKETQKAAYRSFDGGKRVSLWKEKYKLIIEDPNSGFNKAELKDISELYNHVSAEVFSDIEAVRSYVEKWVLKTQARHSWTLDRYRFLLLSLETKEKDYLATKSPDNATASDNFCTCNTINGGVIIDDCSSEAPECHTRTSCRTQQSGCGYWWLDPCDGTCGFACLTGDCP